MILYIYISKCIFSSSKMSFPFYSAPPCPLAHPEFCLSLQSCAKPAMRQAATAVFA